MGSENANDDTLFGWPRAGDLLTNVQSGWSGFTIESQHDST